MTARIVVVGSLNMDLVTEAPKIPAPGETVIGGDLCTVPGGKGANQAVAAARLGAHAAMVGRLGNDVFAARLRDNLAAEGVDLTHVQETAVASGVALIVVDAQGQNSIVVAPGANARLAPADVQAAESVIAAADVILLQLEVPLESVLRAAQLAHEAGVTVVLNPAPAHPLPDGLLALVDILIPNETETASLSGLPVDSTEAIEAAAARLRERGVAAVVLTLGARGALLAEKSGTHHFPAFAVDRVVDTTAAGDAFVAALATSVAEGRPFREAVVWGNAAGALAVTRHGAQPSLPRREEVEALLHPTA